MQKNEESGFCRVPHWVVRDKIWGKLSFKARSVYLVLCDHADYKTRTTRISNKTISEESGISEDRVPKAKQELVKFGLGKTWRAKGFNSSFFHVYMSREIVGTYQSNGKGVGDMSREIVGSYQGINGGLNNVNGGIRPAKFAGGGGRNSRVEVETYRNRDKYKKKEESKEERKSTTTQATLDHKTKLTETLNDITMNMNEQPNSAPRVESGKSLAGIGRQTLVDLYNSLGPRGFLEKLQKAGYSYDEIIRLMKEAPL